MIARSTPVRGFTLIELMVVVCIIGILSTVAMPVMKRATLRARAAEKATLLQSMRTGIEDAFIRNLVPAAGLHGVANPAGLPGPGKRSFVNNLGDWALINVVVQGDTYYTYEFHAGEAGQNTPAWYDVSAIGDLDGDGNQPWKIFDLQRVNGRWDVTNEDPPAGVEDDVRFGNF